ncbi:MAG: hypothetical protein H6609_16295 [Ignavibacteriales bacterium]|nr:hypothetical protein [Ignavibacteriales bacterium]
MSKKDKINIKYNLHPHKKKEAYFDVSIFEKKFYTPFYSEEQNEICKSFPFDANKTNWRVEIFNIDAQCVQGYIEVDTINGVEVIPPAIKNKPPTTIITIEFIHAKHAVSYKPYLRWQCDFFNHITSKHQKSVGNFIAEIFEQVRIWERVQNKLKT